MVEVQLHGLSYGVILLSPGPRHFKGGIFVWEQETLKLHLHSLSRLLPTRQCSRHRVHIHRQMVLERLSTRTTPTLQKQASYYALSIHAYKVSACTHNILSFALIHLRVNSVYAVVTLYTLLCMYVCAYIPFLLLVTYVRISYSHYFTGTKGVSANTF